MKFVDCKLRVGALALTLGAFAVLAGPALAQVTNINSVVIQNRRFNDYPNSTLVTVDNYPTVVSFSESAFGAGGFANQHRARFSTNDTTFRPFLNNEAFDISVNVNLAAGSNSPVKEAGFIMDSFIGGEGFFIVKSNGEAAAFGGPFPFHSFGGSAYTPGTTVNMRMVYRPATLPTLATMEYFFNGVSSGQVNFGNSENGVINGSDFGMYLQNAPDDNNVNDFGNASFTNFVVAVPEPMTMLGLAAGIGILLRRRRK